MQISEDEWESLQQLMINNKHIDFEWIVIPEEKEVKKEKKEKKEKVKKEKPSKEITVKKAKEVFEKDNLFEEKKK